MEKSVMSESSIYFSYSTKRGDTEAVFLVSFRQLVDDIMAEYNSL